LVGKSFSSRRNFVRLSPRVLVAMAASLKCRRP
jgi:hypothetical protein